MNSQNLDPLTCQVAGRCRSSPPSGRFRNPPRSSPETLFANDPPTGDSPAHGSDRSAAATSGCGRSSCRIRFRDRGRFVVDRCRLPAVRRGDRADSRRTSRSDIRVLGVSPASFAVCPACASTHTPPWLSSATRQHSRIALQSRNVVDDLRTAGDRRFGDVRLGRVDRHRHDPSCHDRLAPRPAARDEVLRLHDTGSA